MDGEEDLSERVRLLPLCLLIFIDAMGFAMIAPILAAHPISASPSAQRLLYGIAIGVYPLATFFGAPILGRLSDRSGRLRIMLLCAGGLAASYGVIAWGLQIESAALVIFGRLVGGLTAATQAVALAALADLGAPERKDSRINLGLLASSLGFVLGPALSGALAGIGSAASVSAPLVVIVVLTLGTMLWLGISFDRKADARLEGHSDTSLDVLGSIRELGTVFASPVLRRLSVIFLFQQLGWGAFFFFIAPMLVDRFAFGAAQAGYFMALLGIGFCLSFAFVMPALKRILAARDIGVICMIATTLCIVGSVVSRSVAVDWVLAVPVATAVAAAYGAVILLFVDASDEKKGEVLGVTASINALAFGVTSLIGGVISNESAVAPIVASAVLMVLSTLLLFRLHSLPTPTLRSERIA